jgi:hypothetical protein
MKRAVSAGLAWLLGGCTVVAAIAHCNNSPNLPPLLVGNSNDGVEGGASHTSSDGGSGSGSGSSSGSSSGGSGGSGSSSGSSSSGGGSTTSCVGVDGGCDDLQLCGSKIYEIENASTAPAAAGGAITPGVYRLTSSTAYTGPGGATGQQTEWDTTTLQLGFSDDAGTTLTFQEIYASDTSDGPRTESGVLAVTGPASLFLTTSCTVSYTLSYEYTATATTLDLYPAQGTLGAPTVVDSYVLVQ